MLPMTLGVGGGRNKQTFFSIKLLYAVSKGMQKNTKLSKNIKKISPFMNNANTTDNMLIKLIINWELFKY